MGSEQQQRIDAVARVLSGEPVAKVAAELGRTERWVRKWVARYQPADEAWASDRSRAPHEVANRTPTETEAVVLQIRERLMADQWSQVGAASIAWEMSKLDLTPPELWTIERILRRAGVPKRRARSTYTPRGTPYPASRSLPAPNRVHEIDLVGPRHLAGAQEFYAVNAVDLGRRRAAIEIVRTKQEPDVTAALIALWSRLGIPRVAKFDNGTTLCGSGRTLAQPVRLCLALGITARFIPFGEPWRNPVVEHFNDTFDKRFFRTERFADLRQLRRRAAAFEKFHNTHHRYTVLKGKTPEEIQTALEFTPRVLDPAFAAPTKLPRRGRVEFVRLIRSDRVLKILGVKLLLPEQVIHRYVTATLIVAKHVLVTHQTEIGWRKEHLFPLNP